MTGRAAVRRCALTPVLIACLVAPLTGQSEAGPRGEAVKQTGKVEIVGGARLTLEDAIRLGLERNHGIRIARRLHQIDQLNRSVATADLLPTVRATGHRSTVVEDTWLSEGGIRDLERTGFDQMDAGVELDWTLFDGLRMFAARSRHTELERLGRTDAGVEVERTIRDIILTYYAISREMKLLGALQDAVAFSEERLDIARTMRELGSGSEYQILLARTVLNTDRGEVIRQEARVEHTRTALIRMIGIDSSSHFEVEADIPLFDPLSREETLEGFEADNLELEAARLRESIAGHWRREVSRERFPTIALEAGYGFARDDARLGSPFLEDVRGFRIGVTASLTLFDGLARRRRGQIAGIEWRTRQLALEEDRRILETALRSEFIDYSNARRLVELEQENLELAGEALEIAFEQFRVATITSTELRETQRIVLDTETRLIDAEYDAKTSEIELLRMSGALGRYFGFQAVPGS